VAAPGGAATGRHSQLGLFGNPQGIIHFDSEVTNGTLQLGMPQQQLHRLEIAGFPVDLYRPGSSQ
jgi:hypothetical protein